MQDSDIRPRPCDCGNNLRVYLLCDAMTEKLCECCGIRPIAGYVGCGLILDKLCLKCWRKHGEVAEGHNKKNTHIKVGKS